jgi:pimeloyl-ACP methyl ester carboxylesterase
MAGEGEPLVLVHGGDPSTGGDYNWGRNFSALATHFQVYALDRIGSGLSDKPPIDYTDQAMEDHLAGFIDALCLEKVCMLGNSLGGYAVARYAVDHPTRVRKMVLVGSATIASAMGLETKPTSGARAMRAAVEDPTPENVRTMLEGMLNNRALITDELIDQRLKRITLPGVQDANRSMHRCRSLMESDPNLRQRASLKHRLPELTIPMMLIWGGQDRFAPVELAYQLREVLPNLTAFHVFEKSGHQVQHDEVDRFNQTVIDFLRAA